MSKGESPGYSIWDSVSSLRQGINPSLGPLADDWRDRQAIIPNRLKQKQLVFEAIRAIRELAKLEEEIQRENRHQLRQDSL